MTPEEIAERMRETKERFHAEMRSAAGVQCSTLDEFRWEVNQRRSLGLDASSFRIPIILGGVPIEGKRIVTLGAGGVR